MARRRQSGLDILVEIVSYFHWGIGVALAISAYLFLHWYAGQELYVAKDMSEISSGMLSGVFHGLAGAGQLNANTSQSPDTKLIKPNW